MINIILCVLVVALLCGAFFFYTRELAHAPKETLDDQVGERITLESQINKVTEIFDSLVKRDLSLEDLTEEEYKKEEKNKVEVLTALDRASKGDFKAKEVIKKHIFNMISGQYTGITAETINKIIPFNDESRLSIKDMMEIMYYYYLKKAEKEIKKNPLTEGGERELPTRLAMRWLIEENGFNVPIFYEEEDEPQNIVTPEMVRNAYKKISPFVKHFSFNDKCEIISQRIYEKYKGYDIADMFLDNAGIDEVDAGVSGIPKTGFMFKMLPNMDYSYDHLWIVWKGTSILLKGCGFDSVDDLERVVNNIYKYNPKIALTEDGGYVACSMADDARVLVCMPPFAEDYAFFVRKHDTAKGFLPEQLIIGDDAEYVIKLIKWAVKGKRNVLISGEQNTGKTTFVKSIFHFVTNINVRVNEQMAELGLRYAFPNKNIFSMQETARVSMQDGINLTKKQNGGMNILGEISEAIHTALFCQISQRGGGFSVGTYHGKDTHDCLSTMSQDLQECGIATSLTDGIAKMSKILHINIHLDNDRPKVDINNAEQIEHELEKETEKTRHIGFIDEVIPLIGTSYPYPTPKTQEEHWANEAEYFKRQTDRDVYKINRLVTYKNGGFVIENIFSDDMCDVIASKLSRRKEIEFRKDMEEIKAHIKEKVAV